jgi:hypothetical protein
MVLKQGLHESQILKIETIRKYLDTKVGSSITGFKFVYITAFAICRGVNAI